MHFLALLYMLGGKKPDNLLSSRSRDTCVIYKNPRFIRPGTNDREKSRSRITTGIQTKRVLYLSLSTREIISKLYCYVKEFKYCSMVRDIAEKIKRKIFFSRIQIPSQCKFARRTFTFGNSCLFIEGFFNQWNRSLNLLRWNDVPRTSRTFCLKIALFSQF